jgi:hypothetical protein
MLQFQPPLHTPQELAKHQKKQMSSNIYIQHTHPLARFSNIKSKIKTATATHSFRYPLSTTQRLPNQHTLIIHI